MRETNWIWCLALLIAWCVSPAVLVAAEDGAEDGAEQLAAAIAHHDPEGVWSVGRFELTLEGRRPDGTVTTTVLDIDNLSGVLAVEQPRPQGTIEARVGPGDACAVTLDGAAEIDEAVRAELRLDCDRWRRLRNYYLYMWGLPMKLTDAGTRIGDVRSALFEGAAARELGVTYDAAVGADTWYFYFDPESARAVGYRFYHDETANDSEYIVLEGEVEAGGVRFPRRQTWYMNDDGELLGSDELVRARRLR